VCAPTGKEWGCHVISVIIVPDLQPLDISYTVRNSHGCVFLRTCIGDGIVGGDGYCCCIDGALLCAGCTVCAVAAAGERCCPAAS
jgi:hypothetical protein